MKFLLLVLALAPAAPARAQEDLGAAYGAAAEGLRAGSIAGASDVADPEGVPADLEQELENLPAVDKSKRGHDGSPLTLVFIGEKSQIRYALKHAEWEGVPRSGPVALIEGLGQLLAGVKITKFPPFHSYLVEGRKQDENWAQVVHALTKRHHFRLWKLRERAPDGRPIWWGSASYDRGVRWKFIIPVTHNTDPDIDAERDFIARTLSDAPGVQSIGWVALPQIPREGVNDQKDHYFTDGRALVVAFGPAAPSEP